MQPSFRIAFLTISFTNCVNDGATLRAWRRVWSKNSSSARSTVLSAKSDDAVGQCQGASQFTPVGHARSLFGASVTPSDRLTMAPRDSPNESAPRQ